MALDTNFNVNPYYDDYDEDKKFLRMLFKPGFAVQARELTQLQTIIQKQVQRFGNHVFKNGSVVTGGQTFFQNATFIKLESNYNNQAVTIENFDGKTVVDNISTPTKRAEVIKVFDADSGTGDPKTLMVKEIYGSFSAGEQINTFESATDSISANIVSSGVGTGQIFSVSEGVYYYEGFFVKTDAQTIAVSKYTTTGNARIGFEITESVVTSSSDTSLLDPAQEASNYQAPGSDRFKVEMVLASRSLDSVDDTKFIEIARVENGVLVFAQKYPLYSVLEDTLARRTYDESGNYTVKPFMLALETSSSNTANMVAILSPGKAYVYGYEYETIGPTKITFPKPRDTTSVTNKRITADYGYYVYANNLYGTLPINSLATVDLHCVPNSAINVTSAATISNSKIGTARIKSILFDSAANTSNASTYEYKVYLFDVNVGSISGTVNTAVNVTTIQIANTLIANNYRASATDAYVGAKFRITSGLGSGELPKLITNYNYTNQTIVLDNPFTTTPNNSSAWSIDFEFNDAKSIVVTSATNSRVAAADIDERSKDPASLYGDTVISETSLEPLIFNVGEEFIANNSLSITSLSYRRLYESVSFDASGISTALSVGSGESISTGSSSTTRQQNYHIAVTAVGTGSYKVGQYVPADAFTVDVATRKITVPAGQSMTANIYATIDVSTPTKKTKTYVAGNNSLVLTGGLNLFGNGAVNLFGTEGQLHISANTVIKTPDTPQSLYTSDVISLISVLDFNGNIITEANAAIASDITSLYTLDNGQKDSFYDHSSIRLKTGVSFPVGPLVIKFNQFRSSGAGFFTVDSYTSGGFAYENVPPYTATNGTQYQLRDAIDFRPVRANATVATANSFVFDVDSSTTGPKVPENGSDIILNHQYYLPRNDKIVLNKNKSFGVVKGISSLITEDPKDKDDAMTLYILRNPAYVANTANVDVQYINHKRYTMRDIGKIEKRVENLEYYTTLSLLEQGTLTKQDFTILDSQNLPRFKNGILVDAFDGHSVADVSRNEYKSSIDIKYKQLRPSFNISSYLLEFDSANSSGVTQNGSFVTLNYTTSSFVDQPKASKTININPFNVVNFLGKIEINPKTDVWVDTNRKPDVTVNFGGDKDAWKLIIGNTPWKYEWGDWQTYWSGSQTSQSQFWSGNRLVERSTTTTTSQQQRTSTTSFVAPETITQSLGDKVIDLSIIPYMRNRGVVVVGSSFKPNTTLYPFFDSTLVENYFTRSNKFTLEKNSTQTLSFRTEIGNFEYANIQNTVVSTTNGSCFIAKVSNSRVYVVNQSSNTAIPINSGNLIGTSSGTNSKIVRYDHYSGFVQGSSSNVITLSIDATNANNITDYNSAPVFIVSGVGAGQSATIQSYNPATRNVTITGTWTTRPVASNSVYSIGRPLTDEAGDVVGVFSIPSSTFRVGEKQLRLIDNNTNDVGSSSTNGDTSFFAQGLLQTVEKTLVSATVPTIQRQTVTENRVITNRTNSDRVIAVINWVDPLAQTFLIDPVAYPQGIFISKLRFCFSSKDDTVPITLQLRPTVNGYPSSSVIYPFGTVTLTPDKVKTTTSPDLDNASKYTEFIFDAPVYLLPGEHSFVLLANSNKYETYVAEKGKLDLVTNRQISEQPYGGSLFLSQNGSTWTPDQNSDMMFRIYRNSYSTTSGTAKFRLVAPSSNVVYDLAHFIIGDLSTANTSIAYYFNSIVDGTGADAGLKPFISSEDYSMDDGTGRRVLTTTNNSFVVEATMTTLDPTITPIIDTTRFGIIAIENIINDLPLNNVDVIVSSSGSGYANTNDVTVTISGGGGSGAVAKANVVGGIIDYVYLTSGGSGYTTSPTFTLTPGSGGGSGAVVSYNGEDKKSGGNSNVRYITRKVVLADGFDSGDLRVYLNAYKPSGANIYVYYKILSKSDPQIIDDKNYQLMTELGNSNYVSANKNELRELTFAPGVSGKANNSVSYTSGSTGYTTFRTFAIKIVMSGTNTVDVPKVSDVRVIALPAG